MSTEIILAFTSALAAVASAIVACVSAGIAVYQARLTRQTVAADMMMRLEDQLDSATFSSYRTNAAIALQKPDDPSGDVEVSYVFDFFEKVGLLVNKNILDPDLAYNSFYYAIHGYVRYGTKFIARERLNSPAYYRDTTLVCERFELMTKAKGGVVEADWDNFLELEIGKPAKPGQGGPKQIEAEKQPNTSEE